MPPAPDTAAHAHTWAQMQFELADGHAWVVETCAGCGQLRRYRAFERFWDPVAGRPGARDCAPTARPGARS